MPVINPLDIGKVAGEIMGGLDALVTSGEERAQIRAHVQAGLNKITETALRLEETAIGASRDVMVADAVGHSWLQRNWRPITMISFTTAVVYNLILQPLLFWCLSWLSPETPALPVLVVPGWVGAAITAGIAVTAGSRGMEKVAAIQATSSEQILGGLFDKRRKKKRGDREKA